MSDEKQAQNRKLLIAVVLLSIAMTAVVLATFYLIQRDSDELALRFQEERVAQIQDVSRIVTESVGDVTADLEFLSRLVVGASDAEREAFLQALLGGVGAYRAGAVVGKNGVARQVIVDPRAGELPGRDDIAAMERAAMQALKEGTSVSPLALNQDPWLRAFAQKTSASEAVVLLVDTQSFLDELRILASDPHTWLLVLGPHGSPAPSTSSPILEHVSNPPEALAEVLERMRKGERGALKIKAADAQWVGFEDGDVVVAMERVEVRDGVFWSIASFSSLASIRNAQSSLQSRLIGFATALILVLIFFGGYAFVVVRKTAILEERLRTTAYLSHLHEKAHKVVQSIPIAVGILDSNLEISDQNKAFKEIFGPEFSAIRELLVEVSQTRTPRSKIFENTLPFGDGVFQLHVVPIEPQAEDASVVVIVENLSDLRTLEEQLLRMEKLATVGVLAAGIAHEIGTPLGVVRGRAELIQRKLESESTHQRGLEVIIEQIDRVSRTIQELLDFSRLKEASVESVDLHAVALQVRELLSYELREGLTIDVSIPNEISTIQANPDQVQQVLLNLVINAIDAVQGMEGARVEIGARDESGHVLIWVEDNGPGIPSADRHRVFDPFYTTKKRGQGTGLGLTVVGQIARNHGVELSLSEVSKGARVELRWPSSRNHNGHRANTMAVVQ